jgi:hypothetical protein
MSFIDTHCEKLGIEPICRELAIALSTYHKHAALLPIQTGVLPVSGGTTTSWKTSSAYTRKALVSTVLVMSDTSYGAGALLLT